MEEEESLDFLAGRSSTGIRNFDILEDNNRPRNKRKDESYGAKREE